MSNTLDIVRERVSDAVARTDNFSTEQKHALELAERLGNFDAELYTLPLNAMVSTRASSEQVFYSAL